MAEIFQSQLSATEKFAGDYLRTFARLLDPNLPPRPPYSSSDSETERWPIGQTVAFATIGSLSICGLLAAIIHYFA